MLKNKTILSIIGLFILNYPMLSCDICGCFMGILPYDNQSNLAFFHRYRIFNGYYYKQQPGYFFPSGAYRIMHGSNGNGMVYVPPKYLASDYESYKSYELRAKWFIHSRIELNLIMPLMQIKSQEDTVRANYMGIADPTFLVGWHIIKKIYDEKFQHRLILYSGLKMPLGDYHNEDNYGNRMPVLMQPGTGSWDYLLGFTDVMGFKKFGLMINMMYKINGKNFYDERIANSSTANFMLFYKIKLNRILIVPSWQTYYEYTKGLYVQDNLIGGTCMNVCLSGIGMDITIKNIQFSTGWQWKIYEEHTTNDAMKNKGRIFAGITFNFKQRKYIIR